MMSFPRFPRVRLVPLLISVMLGMGSPWLHAEVRRPVPRTADYILAVVNQELVTANELEIRLAQVREEARRTGSRLPPDDDLRKQLLEALIDERVQITFARDAGVRVDDAELERAIANVASQNQLTPTQLRERLRAEGIDYVRFRNNIRDQLMMERSREREVQARIRISDGELDDYIAKRRSSGADTQFNIAQVLVAVPKAPRMPSLPSARPWPSPRSPASRPVVLSRQRPGRCPAMPTRIRVGRSACGPPRACLMPSSKPFGSSAPARCSPRCCAPARASTS